MVIFTPQSGGDLWEQILDVWQEDWPACRERLTAVFTGQYPDEIGGWVVRSDVLAVLRRFKESVACLRRAEKLVPPDRQADLAILWGNHFDYQLDFPKAEAWYRKSVALQRTDRALVYLGTALARQERREEARDCLKQAVRMKGNYAATACHELGRMDAAEGQLKKALQQFDKALALSPEHVEADDARWDVEQAVVASREAVEDRAVLWEKVKEAYQEDGAAHLREYARKLVEAHPEDAAARIALATGCQRLGAWAAADAELKHVERLMPAESRAMLWDREGQLQAARGKWTAAAKAFQKAATVSSSSETLLRLATALWNQGKLAEAEATCATVLEAAKNVADRSPAPHLGFAEVLRSGGRYAEAGEAYRQALKLGPALQAAQHGLADVTRALKLDQQFGGA